MPSQVSVSWSGPDELKCSICGKPAVCVGRYDLPDGAPPEPACDECCGHGCEDGKCYHLRDEDGELNPEAMEWAVEAWDAAQGASP